MGRAAATSFDRSFIKHTQNYLNTLEASDSSRWDVPAIISYAQQCDPSLRRKTERNLTKACEFAVEYLKGLQDEDSEEEFENVVLVDVPDLNFMNRSLMNVYKKAEVLDSPKKTDSAIVIVTEIPIEPESKTPKRKSTLLKESSKKVKTSESATAKWPTPTLKLKDLGGIDSIAQDLMQLVGMPLKHPEIYRHLGIDPPRGILLHGPPGCGKTMLANAIAGESGVPFISIAAPIIVSGMSGESEKKIRDVFTEARALAPCILFIDEIDAITPKRETAQREMERRIVAQLLTCMDDCNLEKTDYKPVMIIGATNRPDSLDPALRRAGRFDREISMGVPDEDARCRILEKMCEKLKVEGTIGFRDLARLTPGYVGADLNALTAEAGMIAVKRIFGTVISHELEQQPIEDESDDGMMIDGVENIILQAQSKDVHIENSISTFMSMHVEPLSESQLEPLCVTYQDFVNATHIVQPSSKREGFATVPDVTWDDIGALSRVAEELRMAVVEPIKHPEYFASVGISSAMGVLLYGPPGCGKTLLAKAVANESHCNFLSVKGPELLNKVYFCLTQYVGESERAIRMVFSRAQASSPCIIFFDELDALCPSRSNEAESQSSSRLVNTLLTEMDGMTGRKQVFVIAATNRPDMIDPAMLRPGRLDKCLYVDLPNELERHEIMKTLTRKTPLAPDVDLRAIANHPSCSGMSGADLSSLVREAAVTSLRAAYYTANAPIQTGPLCVRHDDFIYALCKIVPSVNKRDRKRYELLKVKFGSSENIN